MRWGPFIRWLVSPGSGASGLFATLTGIRSFGGSLRARTAGLLAGGFAVLAWFIDALLDWGFRAGECAAFL